MAGHHWRKKRAEAVRVLRLAFESGALSALYVKPWCTVPQAKHAVEEFLTGEYPMFVVHVEVFENFAGQTRSIWLRPRKHWRRYARRHHLNPKTGERRG